ncbi:MAG: hypothetical protein HYV26_16730 [Candidatus Hydrogenedentes bacterium]|nr:hypothetical protein [Candidatus Hydrogenedentota bacterium]
MIRSILSILSIALFPAAYAQEQHVASPGPERWEQAIQRFEALDKATPPKKDGILFAGSSTIVFWDLKASFPELDALNRGFGGSSVADILHFFDRVVLPYAPKTIVFYSGDNDIASGKAPEDVFKDYQQFVAKVHEDLPETRLIILGIKPSNARWTLWDKMQQVNRQLQELAKQDRLVEYIDTAPPLLGPDGKPKAELFKSDGLHLNEQGYAAVAPLVQKVLNAPAGKSN